MTMQQSIPEQPADTRVMTVGDWMLTILVLALPIVNIIMYLVWAFSSTGNLNRRNFCRASLYWFLIIFVLWLIAMLMVGMAGILFSALSQAG